MATPGAETRAQLPTGADMRDRIPWTWVLLAAFETACFAVGAVLGVSVVLLRMRGERRG